MDAPIITQARLKELQYALGVLSNNLATHTNESLAKSHGLTLISGFIDVNGNDLTKYRDSKGHIWGDRFLRITTPDSGVFYAPATIVDPVTFPGKKTTTGAVKTGRTASGERSARFDLPEGTAWVTDFPSQATEDTEIINENLLPHTNLAHWETHGQIVVYAKTTFDSPSSGIVGDYVAQITIDGRVYEIPCTKRLGGPAQPVSSLGSIPASRLIKIGSGDSNTVNVKICISGTPGGSAPITFQWQYSNNSVDWIDMAGTQTPLPGGSGRRITHNPATLVEQCLTIISVHPGSGDTRSIYLRVRVTNPTGSVFTNVCRLTCKDETGSWIIKEVMKHREFTSAQIFNIHKLRAWAFVNHPLEAHWYTGPCGKELVNRMREAGFDFASLLPLVEKLLSKLPYQERYELFIVLIYQSYAKYWPDCDHPAWLKAKPQYV